MDRNPDDATLRTRNSNPQTWQGKPSVMDWAWQGNLSVRQQSSSDKKSVEIDQMKPDRFDIRGLNTRQMFHHKIGNRLPI